MKNIIIYAAVFLLLLSCVTAASDVQLNTDRFPAVEDQVEEPHVGRSSFHNEATFCFYTYCWNRRAKCGGGYSCCWCECKNSGAFFSQEKGCYTGTQMKKFLASEGDTCQFYTEKLKLSTVPLFKDPSKVLDIKIGLSPDEQAFQLLPNSTCNAGVISYYDYNGIRKPLYNNKCGEKFSMYRDETGAWSLQWKSTDAADWTAMGGLLLKMDIHCIQSSNEVYSSCILFQVNGKATTETHLSVPDKLLDNYTCPTTAPVIPKHSTAVPIVIGGGEQKKKQEGGGEQKKKQEGGESGNAVSIVAGVLTAVVVLIACIIFLVLLRKRREKKNVNETAVTLLPSPPRPPVQRNPYEDQIMIYEKPTDCGKDYKYYDDKACLYVAVDDEPPRYSSIEEENQYEPPDSRMSTLKRTSYDMSKRPLPKTPTEVNNPYYQACGISNSPCGITNPPCGITNPPSEITNPPRGITNQPDADMRDADNSALYSIYSSIENLKQT